MLVMAGAGFVSPDRNDRIPKNSETLPSYPHALQSEFVKDKNKEIEEGPCSMSKNKIKKRVFSPESTPMAALSFSASTSSLQRSGHSDDRALAMELVF